MDRNLKLAVTETIAKPASAVWHALTDKDLIREYMWGTHASSDWKEGSTITFEGVWEGTPYVETGLILKIEKEKLIKYSYLTMGSEDLPENRAVITYELHEKGDSTTLTVTQEGAKDQEALERSKEGWAYLLTGLKKVVEQE
jgi:uncharacterized protein YndB with AHSA1/START domain